MYYRKLYDPQEDTETAARHERTIAPGCRKLYDPQEDTETSVPSPYAEAQEEPQALRSARGY